MENENNIENPYLEIEDRIKSKKYTSSSFFNFKSFKGISFLLFCLLTLSMLGLVLYDISINIIRTSETRTDTFSFKYGEITCSYKEMVEKEKENIDFYNPICLYDATNDESGDINGTISFENSVFSISTTDITDRFIFYKLNSNEKSSNTFWDSTYEVNLTNGINVSNFEAADYILCYGLPISEKLRPISLYGDTKTIISSSNNKETIYNLNSNLRTVVLRVEE